MGYSPACSGVPRGAGSGLTGGAAAVDGCLAVSTAAMRDIVELNAADQLAVVQAGAVNADLDRAAAELGLMYAPDPSSFRISTIGGNIATNAGGLRCVKYGVTRDSVLGLEVVLADGRILRTGRRTVKGVAGYDLTGLLVGSEGTLGIVTSATVRLRPRPRRAPVTIVGSFVSLRAAADAVAAVVRAGVGPSLLELIDRATLAAIDEWKHIGIEPGTAAMLIAQSDGPDADGAAAAIERHFTEAGRTSSWSPRTPPNRRSYSRSAGSRTRRPHASVSAWSRMWACRARSCRRWSRRSRRSPAGTT